MLTAPAWGQNTVQPASADEPPLIDEIVVTGSRIASKGFEAPSPVTVLQTEQLIQRAPGTIADALNQLPAFQNSINQNQLPTANPNVQRSGNYLNLRALGTQRVLVLQDGQRLPPSGNNGGVDANLIPQLLVERVDIVTGGGSAAYGSDAVSGVVNFILNKRFKGVKAQIQRGVASGGYAGSYRVGVAAGTSLLDDRLHIIASAERYHIDRIAKTSLPIIADGWVPVGSGTTADPFRYISGARAVSAEGGFTQSGPAGFVGKQFAPNSDLVAYNTGLPAGRVNLQIGGDGLLQAQQGRDITPSVTTNQLFGRGEYDLTPSLSVFASIGYNTASNYDQPGSRVRVPSTIFRNNAYLTPATLALLGNAASFNITRTFNDLPPNNITQDSKSLLVTAGIQGKLRNLSWNVGYVHGDTKFLSSSLDTLNQNFFAALDAVRDPATNNIVCNVSLTNPGLYPGCVPINIMGVGNVTPQALAYIESYSQWRVRNKMDSFQALISGDLFSGWAGPISFALGGEYRKQSLVQTSNANPAIATTFTGLRGVAASAMNRYFVLNNGIGAGSYNIKEAFGELNVPILKDSAVGSLSINGAGRVTDYSTSGTVVTWKAGALYDPIDGIRFRLTRSRDIRAPTLYELFAGQTITRLGVLDKLTGLNVSTQSVSGGNPNLKPEIANTLTAGVIFKPSFIRGFNLSIDYFNINIDKAIGAPFTGQQVMDICAASNYSSPVCDQIIRPLGAANPDPNNGPTAVLINNQNLRNFKTSGIDFELRYQLPVGSGKLTIESLATRLLSSKQQNAPGQAVFNFLGNADMTDGNPIIQPKWRGNVNVTYETGPFTLSVQERIIGSLKRSNILVYQDNSIGAVAYTDISAVARVPSKFGGVELFGTVNNLFNRKPPIIPTSTSPGLAYPTIRSAYDIIGTYVTIGARLKM
jgi:outer membrane receptor protein involved in Fe transport